MSQEAGLVVASGVQRSKQFEATMGGWILIEMSAIEREREGERESGFKLPEWVYP